MRTLLRHKINETAELVMEEHRSDFTVTYLTKEEYDGEMLWFANKSELFKSESDAIRAFNKRRDSGNPFLISSEI
jgi:hypothetical protein